MDINKTSLYIEIQALRKEIDRHKWLESEKVGHDIGFTKALIDWTIKHKSQWLANRKKKNEKRN